MGDTVLVGEGKGGKVAVQLGEGVADPTGETVSAGAEITALVRNGEGCTPEFADPQAETTTAKNRIEKSLFQVKLPLLNLAGHYNRSQLPWEILI